MVVVLALAGAGLALTRGGPTDVNAGSPGTASATPTTKPLRNTAAPADGGRIVVGLAPAYWGPTKAHLDAIEFRSAPPDPDVLNIFFHSRGDALINFNLGHYDDPQVDTALDTARQSADESVRREAITTVIHRENAIGAYQFLLSEPFALVADTKVTGLDDSLSDNLLRGGATPWCLRIGIEH